MAQTITTAQEENQTVVVDIENSKWFVMPGIKKHLYI